MSHVAQVIIFVAFCFVIAMLAIIPGTFDD